MEFSLGLESCEFWCKISGRPYRNCFCLETKNALNFKGKMKTDTNPSSKNSGIDGESETINLIPH